MSIKNHHTLFKNLTAVCLTLLTHFVYGQEHHDQPEDYIQHFRLEDEGSPAHEFLKEQFAATDYLVLGETHFSRQIGAWVKYWAKSWQEMGYSRFLAEVGPVSAGKLTELLDGNTTDAYHDFVDQYRLPNKHGYPIAFFDGEEDVAFMNELFKYGFTLRGIDQEFVYSFPYLWDELFTAQGKPEAAQDAKSQLDIFSKQAYNRKMNDRGYNIFADLYTNDTVKNYYQALGPLNAKARKIKSAIESSPKIYDANVNRTYSHVKRIHYIRSLARQILESNQDPNNKYIVKIGRLHAGKYRQYDAYDIGHLLHERAKTMGQKSLHIGFLRGYYQNKDGNISDPATIFDGYYFRQHASKDQWTLIDLRKYAQGLAKGTIQLPDSYTQQLILSDLDNFDLLLIPPLDQKQTPLRKEVAQK